MSEKLARLTVLGALEGPSLSAEELDFLSQGETTGVILFRRNLPQHNFLDSVNLTRQLQCSDPSYKQRPMFIAIDQEGGRVSRFGSDFPNQGPALHLAKGQTDPAALSAIKSYGLEVGSALRRIGININFAPVLDILSNPLNECIGDRVFGTTADSVIKRAGAFLDGLNSSETLACLKHFPGQGDAAVDTHLGTARIDHSFETLLNRELQPFAALVSKSPLVMVAHCIYNQIDNKEATRSEKIIKHILQNKLNFRGLIVSDDMNMGAMPLDEQDWIQALIESLLAGTHLLIIGRHLERWRLAVEGISREAKKSTAFYNVLENAAKSVVKMRQKIIHSPIQST
ncbi:MAG: glycoside hydrolase family 3 protein [Oligoflexales bacterium]|nr:glycoside hydrolase family 3 protein [Oligoflexales bacterium]